MTSMTGTPGRYLGLMVAIAVFALVLVGAKPVSARQATPAPSPVAVASGHPAHIHDGSCAALGAVAYPLENVIGTSVAASNVIAVELGVTSIDVTLETILAAPRAINVHQSVDNIASYIACGDIGGTPNRSDLFIGLGELNGSGYSGIAWLHDNGDGSTTVSVFNAMGLSGGTPPMPGATPVASPTA